MGDAFDNIFTGVKVQTNKIEVPKIIPKVEEEVEETDETIEVNTKHGTEVIDSLIRKQFTPKDTRLSITEALTARQGIKLLLFGRQGTWKSSILMDAPAPKMIINLENGLTPLIESNMQYQEMIKNGEIAIFNSLVLDEKTMNYDETATMQQFDHDLNIIKNEAIKYHNETGKLMTIGIDSMTIFWEIIKMWLNVEIIRVEGSKTSKGKPTINKKGVPSDRRNWDKLSKKWNGVIASLMNIPANVIMIAQAKDAYDSEEGTELGFDEPRVRKETPHAVDLAIQTFTDENGIRGFARVFKSRYKKIKKNQLIENLSIQKLMDMIK